MSNREQLIGFALLMGRESKATTYDVAQVMRNSKSHARLCEVACNRTLTASEERKLTQLEAGFEAWAKRVGVKGVIVGRDPRGCTVKLVLKSGKTNDFGQEGVCVPQ